MRTPVMAMFSQIVGKDGRHAQYARIRVAHRVNGAMAHVSVTQCVNGALSVIFFNRLIFWGVIHFPVTHWGAY